MSYVQSDVRRKPPCRLAGDRRDGAARGHTFPLLVHLPRRGLRPVGRGTNDLCRPRRRLVTAMPSPAPPPDLGAGACGLGSKAKIRDSTLLRREQTIKVAC